MGFDLVKKIIVCLLIGTTAVPASAAPRTTIFDREKQNALQVSEYIYGDELEQRLVPINLLGAVQRPGIYHVPPNTSLVTLLSIAGGTNETSVLDEITIRSETSGRNEKVDFEKIISSGEKSPLLKGQETIFIPTQKPAISTNTVLLVSVLATLIGATLSVIMIRKEI